MSTDRYEEATSLDLAILLMMPASIVIILLVSIWLGAKPIPQDAASTEPAAATEASATAD
ncbi:MAG: hypothetical protein ACFCGT_20455 [Sandaracinaceae bacterium]